MNNREMISIESRLRSMVEEIVYEAINRLPVSIPATVDERNKSTVAVVPVIAFGGVTPSRIDDVPIAKSPYFNDPIQKGDFGLLVPCSYFYQTLVTDNLNTVESVYPTVTTGNYVFFPIARVDDNPSSGGESEIWSKGKSRTLRVGNDRIELGATSGQATEYTALNTALQLLITALSGHTHSSGGSGPPTAPFVLDISAAKKDTVTL